MRSSSAPVKFSAVMPVKEAEPLLSVSLPSLYRLEPDEVIIVLDRRGCLSESIANHVAARMGMGEKTAFLAVERDSKWKTQIGKAVREGFKAARNNYIFKADADVYYNPRIRRYFGLITRKGVGLVSFAAIDRPTRFSEFIRAISNLLAAFIYRGFSGVFVVDKAKWLETERQERAKAFLAEDTHLALEIERGGYRRLWIRNPLALNVNLRPGTKNGKLRQTIGGAEAYVLYLAKSRRWWLKAFITALRNIWPYWLISVLWAKRSFSCAVQPEGKGTGMDVLSKTGDIIPESFGNDTRPVAQVYCHV